MSGFATVLNQPPPTVTGTPVASYQATTAVAYPVNPPSEEADIHLPGINFMKGFELWLPPKPNSFSDGLPVYEIIGTDAQYVQLPLRAGRQIMCFAGAMAYMSDGMKMKVEFGGFGKTFGRLAGGGSLFQATYTNETPHDGYIAMTPDYPGVIVPINMLSCPSGKIVAMRDSFLCSTVDMNGQPCNVSAGFNPAQSVGGVCCGGVDLIVQTVSNGEWAFLVGMGTVVQKVGGCCVSSVEKGFSSTPL